MQAEPRFSIRIDPELRRLRAGGSPLPPAPPVDAGTPASAPPVALGDGAVNGPAAPVPGSVPGAVPSSAEQGVAPGVEDAAPDSVSGPSGLSGALLRQPHPGSRPRRLRRDGQRPLRFDGTRLVSQPLQVAAADPTQSQAAERGQIALYLASDGRIAAEVSGCVAALTRNMTPDGVRLVHGAAWISDPSDLDRLLSTLGLPQARPPETDN